MTDPDRTRAAAASAEAVNRTGVRSPPPPVDRCSEYISHALIYLAGRRTLPYLSGRAGAKRMGNTVFHYSLGSSNPRLNGWAAAASQ